MNLIFPDKSTFRSCEYEHECALNRMVESKKGRWNKWNANFMFHYMEKLYQASLTSTLKLSFSLSKMKEKKIFQIDLKMLKRIWHIFVSRHSKSINNRRGKSVRSSFLILSCFTASQFISLSFYFYLLIVKRAEKRKSSTIFYCFWLFKNLIRCKFTLYVNFILLSKKKILAKRLKNLDRSEDGDINVYI